MDKKEEIEKAADDLLCEIMKNDPTKLVMMMLVQVGKMCIDANAETMAVIQEADIKNSRYKITCKIQIKKL